MRSGGIFDVEGRLVRIQELETIAGEESFWRDPTAAQRLMKEKADLERVVQAWQEQDEAVSDSEVLLELAVDEDDEDTLKEVEQALPGLEESLRGLEMRRILSGSSDRSSAIMEINSGAGGKDAADWADMLKRMYLRWADRMGFKVRVMDEQQQEEGGISHCTMQVEGEYAYGYLQSEIGVHRLVRISPFDKDARRHTAFASVGAIPAIDDDIEVDVAESDLRIDTFRSSGAGGQHVNTTDSAVRITHLPTNTVVVCRSERSQHKNKSQALKLLRAKLHEAEEQRRRAEAESMHQEKKRIEWGSQIRSYVLQPYRLVKDVRTGMEMGNVDRFLDGDIISFMEAWLVHQANEQQNTG